jgi:choice-of-anchor A domain-containing protein
MNKISPALLILSLVCVSSIGHATSAPFETASAFNLVALGTVNSHGDTVIAGNVGTGADVEGRIAAANDITQATTVGSTLGSDPWGSLAGGYAIVAGNAITSGNYFNVNGGGNVYAPGNNAGYNWNENPHGTLVTAGSDPIDFAGLRTFLDGLTLNLAALPATGVIEGGSSVGGNPSWLVLYGTSTTLNVFTVTAAQFASANNPLDIDVPVGSTVIINVLGTNVTLGTGIYFDGNQEGDNNNDGGRILFNFSDASSVSIDGQLDGAVLAPFAVYTSNSQVGGTIMAARIGQTGEAHNIEFEGTLPAMTSATPEPGTLLLMGTGLMFMTFFGGRQWSRGWVDLSSVRTFSRLS